MRPLLTFQMNPESPLGNKRYVLLQSFVIVSCVALCAPATNERRPRTLFDNSSVFLPPVEDEVEMFLDGVGRLQLENYRKRFGGGYGSGGNGDGVYSYAVSHSSSGGGGGWLSGVDIVGKKKGQGSHHYNPSVNRYGGGGPIKFIPGSFSSPNYGSSSYVPTNTLEGEGPVVTPVVHKETNGGGGHSYGGGIGGVGTTILVSEEAIALVICDESDGCNPFTHCGSYSSNFLQTKDRCCAQTRRQAMGMCCSVSKDEAGSGRHFGSYRTNMVPTPDVSQEALESAAHKGYEYRTTYDAIEKKLMELGIVVEKGTADYGHLLFFQTTPAMLHVARDNLLVIKATNYIRETYFLTNSEAGIGLQGYDFEGTVFQKTCFPLPKCEENSKYRTADGSCNNPASPKLGQSSTPLIRLLPPDYADGVWAPRVRKDGTPLPSARFITLALIPDLNLPDLRYSHMLMQFGQFVDHDLSHVPMFRFPEMSGIQCCSQTQTDVSHPACFPIEIPPFDLKFRGQRCMNFIRSMVAPRLDCSFGHADQLNQITHWLDASQIYGNTFEQAESLREFSGGRLRASKDRGGREFLPEDAQQNDRDCAITQAQKNGGNGHCYLAGDRRVNEQIGLTSLHTIFHREHNRLAFELSCMNPHWDDEILYQESRRIVIAEYQHILYNEWIPLVIGREYMETFGILPLHSEKSKGYKGYEKGYDSGIDARVSNAFTTAAFRFGHSIVQGSLNLKANGGGHMGQLFLRDVFNNPSLLPKNGMLDFLTEGLVTQPMQRFDNYITTELRDHLFETPNSPGMDLPALNIQRGRDHGLPSYNQFRDLCRVGKARDFSDLAPVIHPRKISQLERVYGNVNDIDLFVGGLHETPVPGAIVGPTFACIIGDQFVRSKRGDLFFYDVGGHAHSFSLAQLHEIRGVSMSRILCDNTDEIRSIQPLAFHLPHRGFNPLLPCGSPSIRRLKLNAWRE